MPAADILEHPRPHLHPTSGRPPGSTSAPGATPPTRQRLAALLDDLLQLVLALLLQVRSTGGVGLCCILALASLARLGLWQSCLRPSRCPKTALISPGRSVVFSGNRQCRSSVHGRSLAALLGSSKSERAPPFLGRGWGPVEPVEAAVRTKRHESSYRSARLHPKWRNARSSRRAANRLRGRLVLPCLTLSDAHNPTSTATAARTHSGERKARQRRGIEL